MEGVVALMRASSASGRGASRTTRGPAKVVRMPVAGKLRHQQMMRAWMITIIAAVVALGFAVRFERPQIQTSAPQWNRRRLNSERPKRACWR